MSGRNLQFHSEASDWPEDLFPQGRCRFSYRTKDKDQAERYRKKTIDWLREHNEYKVLRAVQEDVFGIDHVHAELWGDEDESITDALAELKAEMEGAAVGQAPTYGEVMERYLAEYSVNQAPGTQRRHDATLKPFGRQMLNGRPVKDYPITRLSHSDIKAVLGQLDIQPGTRETYRGTLAGMWTWYMDWERGEHLSKGRPRLVQYNAPAEIARVRSKGEVTTLDDHQVRAVIAAARPHERVLFRTIVELGLRAGEVIHLRKDVDVDLEEEIIHIQPRGADPNHKCDDCRADGWSPKRPRSKSHNNNSIRDLHLPEERRGLVEALKRHAAMWPVDSGEYFFQNPSVNSSGPFTYETLRYRFKRACEKTDGVVRYGQNVQGGVTLHSLRHTCATNMILNGVHLSIAAKVLGHTVATLESTYSHILDDDTRIGLAAVSDYGLDGAAKEVEVEADEDLGDAA